MEVELKVLKGFRDKYDSEKMYKEGDCLCTEELNRVNDLVARGMCVIASIKPVAEKTATEGSAKIQLFEREFEVEAVKAGLTSIGVSIAKNAGVSGVGKKLTELTEEQTNALKEILCKDPN